MLRHIKDVMQSASPINEKDYLGSKQFILNGKLLSFLFEDLFKTMSSQAAGILERARREITPRSIEFALKPDVITYGLERAIKTGNWDLKQFRMNLKGVSQVLCRLSHIGTLSHTARSSMLMDNNMILSHSKLVHPSQFGMVCPCDTPRGEEHGLTKNLTLLTHISTYQEEGTLKLRCRELGVEGLSNFSLKELGFLPVIESGSESEDDIFCMEADTEPHTSENTEIVEVLEAAAHPDDLLARMPYSIILNGLIIGMHRDPQLFAKSLKSLRRSGAIGESVSIFVHDQQRCIYLATDAGRLCRPFIIADEGVARIKGHHIDEIKAGTRTFDTCLREGLIEFLDVDEQNNCLIAFSENSTNKSATHLEIELFSTLGVCAGTIPFISHNYCTNSTYQCAYTKQAMGSISYNQHCRADDILNLLVYPQRPLLTTKAADLVGYDKLGAGQNATVAVMSYSGYDLHDAIVMNKASLERGFGRSISLRKYSVLRKKYKYRASEKIKGPKNKLDHQLLDHDGLASPGEKIRKDDIYVNKYSPTETKVGGALNYSENVAIYKGNEGVVDRVLLTSNTDKDLQIKLIIRQTYTPEVGDKFADRHGLAGVVGIIIKQEDLPFSERGICPDLIINPHGIPGQKAFGTMLEVCTAKAAASSANIHYADGFNKFDSSKDGEISLSKEDKNTEEQTFPIEGESSKEIDHDSLQGIGPFLIKCGFNYMGKDLLYSGITGDPLQSYIYMGQLYYQKLKYMVVDKMRVQTLGPSDFTRDPADGARIGEMEKDCLVSYGASNLILERFMISSGSFEAKVCKDCGMLGYRNFKLRINWCTRCKTSEHMATVKLPYATKLLFQELMSMNIVPRIILRNTDG